MHRQSSAGHRSKWELVHYGPAARYFTTHLEIGEDEEVIVTDSIACQSVSDMSVLSLLGASNIAILSVAFLISL